LRFSSWRQVYDPERKAALQEERVNAEVARLIHDMRNAAGLSQQQLAELIGTTQSVISRLEDADYEGRSLSLLERIATALNQKLTVVMTAREPEELEIREAFHRVVQMLRRSRDCRSTTLQRKLRSIAPSSWLSSEIPRIAHRR
jgi:transcriptional regulator with XRE-family HTH domain